jgi:hypothetical protein
MFLVCFLLFVPHSWAVEDLYFETVNVGSGSGMTAAGNGFVAAATDKGIEIYRPGPPYGWSKTQIIGVHQGWEFVSEDASFPSKYVSGLTAHGDHVLVRVTFNSASSNPVKDEIWIYKQNEQGRFNSLQFLTAPTGYFFPNPYDAQLLVKYRSGFLYVPVIKKNGFSDPQVALGVAAYAINSSGDLVFNHVITSPDTSLTLMDFDVGEETAVFTANGWDGQGLSDGTAYILRRQGTGYDYALEQVIQPSVNTNAVRCVLNGDTLFLAWPSSTHRLNAGTYIESPGSLSRYARQGDGSWVLGSEYSVTGSNGNIGGVLFKVGDELVVGKDSSTLGLSFPIAGSLATGPTKRFALPPFGGTGHLTGPGTWYVGAGPTVLDFGQPITNTTVAFSVSRLETPEASEGVNITVTVQPTPTAPVEVTLLIGGTASEGADYQPVSRTLTLPAGASSANLFIIKLDDAIVEPEETISINILPGAYQLGTVNRADVVILANDLDSGATLMPYRGFTPSEPYGSGNKRTGTSLAMHGSRLIAGAPLDGSGSGSAYILEGSETGIWNQVARLVPEGVQAAGQFGRSVGIGDDWVVVGAPLQDSTVSDTGGVYLYRRESSGDWALVTAIDSPSPAATGQFGYALSVFGDMIAIGAPGEAGGGRCHLFRLDGAQVQWVATLNGPGLNADARFGCSVSIFGHRLVVGAEYAVVDGAKQGGGHVFQQDGTLWSHQHALSLPETDMFACFGHSVCAGDGMIAVGAPCANGQDGSVVVFQEIAGQWTQTRRFESDATFGSNFNGWGCAVSLHGHTLCARGTDPEAVASFEYSAASGWGLPTKLGNLGVYTNLYPLYNAGLAMTDDDIALGFPLSFGVSDTSGSAIAERGRVEFFRRGAVVSVPTLEFADVASFMREGGDGIHVNVVLQRPSGLPQSVVSFPVYVSVTDGSSAGILLEGEAPETRGPFQIDVDSQSTSITLAVPVDSLYEPGRRVVLRLGSPSGAVLGPLNTHFVNVAENRGLAQVPTEVPSPDAMAGFGKTVALHHGRVAVGQPDAADGRVVVFTSDGSSTWTPAQTIAAPSGRTGFGIRMFSMGDELLIGSNDAIHVYALNDSGMLELVSTLSGGVHPISGAMFAVSSEWLLAYSAPSVVVEGTELVLLRKQNGAWGFHQFLVSAGGAQVYEYCFVLKEDRLIVYKSGSSSFEVFELSPETGSWFKSWELPDDPENTDDGLWWGPQRMGILGDSLLFDHVDSAAMAVFHPQATGDRYLSGSPIRHPETSSVSSYSSTFGDLYPLEFAMPLLSKGDVMIARGRSPANTHSGQWNPEGPSSLFRYWRSPSGEFVHLDTSPSPDEMRPTFTGDGTPVGGMDDSQIAVDYADGLMVTGFPNAGKVYVYRFALQANLVPASLELAENQVGGALVQALLTQPTFTELEVPYVLSGSATLGDLFLTRQTLHFAANGNVGEVGILPKNDRWYEGDETALLQLLPSAEVSVGLRNLLTITIKDDDVPAHAPELVQTEANVFTMDRSRYNGEEVTHFWLVGIDGVDVRDAGGNVLSEGGFVSVEAGHAGLTFEALPGAVEQRVRVVGAFEALPEAAGFAVAELDLNASVGPVSFVMSEPEWVVSERGREAVIEVVKSGGDLTAGAVWGVDVAFEEIAVNEGPRAVANNFDAGDGGDEDYTVPPEQHRTLYFRHNTRVMSLPVPLTDDGVAEARERFRVRLTNARIVSAAVQPASVGVQDSALVSIVDDDGLNSDVAAKDTPVLVPGTGALSVTLTPSNIGAQWRIGNEPRWRSSGEVVLGLAPNAYQVQFKAVAGYQAPGSHVVQVGTVLVNDAAEYVSGGSVLTGSLSITIQYNPVSAPLTPGQWREVGTSVWQSSGEVVSGLAAGSHAVEFSVIGGHEAPLTRLVIVPAGGTGSATVVYKGVNEFGVEPTVQLFEDMNDGGPLSHLGQIETPHGTATGTVVAPHVVLTAAHALFDEEAYAWLSTDDVLWKHRRYVGEHEPVGVHPAGWQVFTEGYGASYQKQRELEGTPGRSSLAARELDVAALHFVEFAGSDGSHAGFVSSSDELNQRWLMGATRERLLAGYPVVGIANASDAGKPFATPASTGYEFTHLYHHVYGTSDLRSHPGNSGGPIFVKVTAGELPAPYAAAEGFFPAAIYLGERVDDVVVRGLDEIAAEMIARAEAAAGGASVQFDLAESTSSEDAAAVHVIGVTLSASSSVDVIVPLIAGGSAERGVDYTLSADAITIPAGQTSGSVSVTLIQDSLFEGEETVELMLGVIEGAVAGTQTRHVVSITDDEPALRAPVIVVGSVDAAGGTFTVARHGLNGGEVTHFRLMEASGVRVLLDDGLTPVGVGQWITVAQGAAGLIFEDESQDGALARLVSFVSAAGVTPGQSGSEAGVAGLEEVSAGAVQFRLGSIRYSSGEETSQMIVTVIKSGAGSAGVVLEVEEGTAKANDFNAANGQEDYTVPPLNVRSMSFGEREVRKSLSIPVNNDGFIEGNESFTVRLAAPTGGAALGSISSAACVIVDDETDATQLGQVLAGAVSAVTGSLVGEIEPSTLSGAAWRIASEREWRGGGQTLTGLQAGEYEIDFAPVFGFETPARTKILVKANKKVGVIGWYRAVGIPESAGSLTVNLNAGQWRRRGQATWRNGGDSETGLKIGEHIVEFRALAGQLEPPPRKVLVKASGTTRERELRGHRQLRHRKRPAA